MKKIRVLLSVSLLLLLTACNGEELEETKVTSEEVVVEAIIDDSLVGVYEYISPIQEDTPEEEVLLELSSDGKFVHSRTYYEDADKEGIEFAESSLGYVMKDEGDLNSYLIDSSADFKIETLITKKVFQSEDEMMTAIENYSEEYIPYYDREYEIAEDYIHITLTATEETMSGQQEGNQPILETIEEGIMFEGKLFQKR
ncbi:hypothetical protein [Jeotgalibaca ciconiae]|uniref:DUF1307 domain-containing protein n=1 Tax=Jeotgalibaca ciconiae TaxID=2496265 RepID=A0A3Q9BL23_9LACT|nr:hypothetical protein [Jeotgalibaca ciconiae]AZP04861.1 hypothetical protein EJN90_09525 [Jeotgalibaca ciconiae]